MTTAINPPCPKCSSAKTMAVPDSPAFVCYDCKHEFTPEKVISPLRIFLSYGHDGNEELVRRIKTDLEKRKHDVWFDKNEIKFGDEWRRAITDGILQSNRVLSFLSKHSKPDYRNAYRIVKSFALDIVNQLAGCHT